MQPELYAFIVSAMRYFFAAAIVYILIELIRHSASEYGELRRVKNWIEKGYAKHIEFLPPFDTNEDGFILVKSNLIGRSRACDICIEDKSVKRRHALIYEKRGEAYIRRRLWARVTINGFKLEKRRARLEDGDLIGLGEVEFYYRLKRVPMEEAADEQG